ncbi:MAG: hypothetical protein LBS26_07155 [Campylobacteraceae bacterium]|jgi:hypothetical protein|nr:hypothetical protein [Campylobacteraceae bacterium]
MTTIIITAACILALVMIIYVSRYRYYDLNRWSGVLIKWADDNGISRKRMPRYDEKTLLNIKELDFSELELQSLPEELCNLINLKKLYLQNNNLKSLPQNITNLNPELLDLRGNNELQLSAKQKTWTKKIKEFLSNNPIKSN